MLALRSRLFFFVWLAASFGVLAGYHNAHADGVRNLSTRGLVTPDIGMAGGIVVEGAVQVLITGRGPSTGLTTALEDTSMRLFKIGGGLPPMLMMENDNWGDNDNASEISDLTTARPLSSSEPALLVNLTSGAYSAVVSDNTGSGDGGEVVLGFTEIDDDEAESCAFPDPVLLNNGETTLWTATLTTTGNAVYPTLEVLIAQNGTELSGQNRDNLEEVDVSSTGTIDGCGNFSLTSTMTNGSNPRAVIMFTGTVSGSGSSQTISGTYTATGPAVPTSSGTESGTFSMQHSGFTVPPDCTSASPVMLNNGESTLWTATLTTIGNAVYPTLEVRIEQTGADLSGENRDNNKEVDVSSDGTIDGCGDLSLTSTITNSSSPRAVIMFTGTVSGSGSSETISGTYTATGPSVPTSSGTESGTFSMTHN